MRSPVVIFLSLAFLVSCDQQKPDPDFNSAVRNPAFTKNGPRVLFDEAHNNIHTSKGTYRPFVDLIANDGCIIAQNEEKFSATVLRDHDILVISNAKGAEKKFDPAFSPEECSAVEEWVRNGGNLLLIADHHPMGKAASSLAEKFGVIFTTGFTNDSVYFDSTSFTPSRVDGRSQLVFSRTNSLLGEHPILSGRDSSERINRIITFTGQSMRGPEGSTSLLILSPHAVEVIPDSIWEEPDMIFFTNTFTRFAEPISVEGASQGLAFEYGKGRVVMLGEAAMLTAQKAKEERFGMNVPGIDNRQLALNIMRWLGRAF